MGKSEFEDTISFKDFKDLLKPHVIINNFK